MASPLLAILGANALQVAAACSTILLRMRRVALNTTKIAGPDRPSEERRTKNAQEEEHGVLSSRQKKAIAIAIL